MAMAIRPRNCGRMERSWSSLHLFVLTFLCFQWRTAKRTWWMACILTIITCRTDLTTINGVARTDRFRPSSLGFVTKVTRTSPFLHTKKFKRWRSHILMSSLALDKTAVESKNWFASNSWQWPSQTVICFGARGRPNTVVWWPRFAYAPPIHCYIYFTDK